MKRSARFLSMLLVLALLASLPLAGLSEGLSPAGELPIAKERTKLSILMQQDTLVEDYETNAFTKFIEDSCNVDLEFELLPADGKDAKEKLAVMISSGQKLPDIVNFNLDVATTYRYAQAGAFVPLNDYIDKYGVNYKKVMETYPQFAIDKNITCPDGNVYGLPQFFKGLHDETKYKVWINIQWLENLGLEMPRTTEEFYEVLKAFKTRDPNGNGKQDEYPMVGGTGWSQDPTVFLMNAFIFDDATNHFNVTDGKLSLAYMKEGWKKGLEYMNRLVSEDLLAPLSFTQDDAQLRAMVNNQEDCIVGAFCFSSITLMPVATCPYVQYYRGLEPLKGPDGVQGISYQPTIPTARWFVTADCQNPELAFRVGDFLFNPDEEVGLRARYGIEGEHWHRPGPDDVGEYADAGFEPMWIEDVNIWSVAQNAHWRNNAPMIYYKLTQGGVKNPDPTFFGNYITEIVTKLGNGYLPQEGTYVGNIIYNEEELLRITEVKTTLNTYVNESKARFITGDLNLQTDWDAYLKELDRIGVQEFLEISQAAYDRMMGK